MKASIIIPVLNQLDCFKELMESIYNYTKKGSYELVIIDNGSDNQTKEYIQLLDVDIVIINKTNRGVAKAWNDGIKVATTDKYLILNSDIVVCPDWFVNMVKGLDEVIQVHPSGVETTEAELETFHERAKEYSAKLYGLITTTRLNGYCFGLSKECIDNLG